MSLSVYSQTQTETDIDLTPIVEERNGPVFIWNLAQTKQLAKIVVENKANRKEIEILEKLKLTQDSTIWTLDKINRDLVNINQNLEKQIAIKSEKSAEIMTGYNRCEQDNIKLSRELDKTNRRYARYKKCSLITIGSLAAYAIIKSL